MGAIVALVGRPNVGKSTLFNRLIGERQAVVHQTPGTTRDRLYGTVEWRGRIFTLVDTGGIGLDEGGDIEHSIATQAQAAISQADAIVFLTDGQSGPLAPDVDIAQRLRQSQRPIILAVNKADSPKDRQGAAEFYELGLGDPVLLSAIRGTGTGDLLDEIVEALPQDDLDAFEPEDEDLVRVAIVGRPNVGKSSLLNAIVGEERAIVSDVPGTTRDAVDTLIEREGHRWLLVDTAGIRRRGKVARGIETYSVMRAMRAIERADVVVVVIDAEAGVTAQDAHVAGYVHDQAKGCVIALNKWDLIERSPQSGADYLALARRELPFLDYAPVLFFSAKTGLNVGRLLTKVGEVAIEYHKRVSTAQVNEFFREAFTAHPHSERGNLLKLLYATQASTAPPTFVLFVSDPALAHFSYRRYLENQVRRRFGFEGSGIKLVFRGRTRED
jgi:GTP-binding protein